MPAIDHITIARQMVTGGTASAKLRDELADYDRMSRIIESAAAEGRTVGRNVHYWRDTANANVRQMVEAMTPAEPESVVAASNNDWEDDDDALIDEPTVWIDHTGKAWRLSRMESAHLVNILRLVVNRWAESLGVRPVPIKNPQAILNPEMPEAWLAVTSQRMAEELLRRLDKGEQLPSGYTIVWERVVNKIQECLRRSQQPLNQKLLTAPQKLLCAR